MNEWIFAWKFFVFIDLISAYGSYGQGDMIGFIVFLGWALLCGLWDRLDTEKTNDINYDILTESYRVKLKVL